MPSVDDIRENALPMPVYTAAGDVANTCILVCDECEISKLTCDRENTL